MNILITDIMKLLRVDEATAHKVRDRIDYAYGLDYSECSNREFNKTVRLAFGDINCKHEYEQGMVATPQCIYCGTVASKAEMIAALRGSK